MQYPHLHLNKIEFLFNMYRYQTERDIYYIKFLLSFY